MSFHRILALSTTAALLAAIFYTWIQLDAARRLDQDRATLLSQTAQLEAEAAQLNSKIKDTEATIQTLQSQKKTVASSAATTPTFIFNPIVTLDKNPELQVLIRKTRRSSLQAYYAPLFRRLGLSVEQIEAFKDHVLDREEAEQDIMAAARSQGFSRTDPAVASLLTKAEQEYQAAQRSLLGEPAYQQLADYSRTVALRDFVSGIAAAATVKGTPINSDEAEKLIHLIAAASPSYQKGGDAEFQDADWEVVDAQAREFMTEQQWNAFRTAEGFGPSYAGSLSMTILNQAISRAIEAEKRQKAQTPTELTEKARS